jgi:hypothetical protein
LFVKKGDEKMKSKIMMVLLITTLLVAIFAPAVQSLQTSTINSTKNEIASSDLPYWLDGTILDGTHRVIVTPFGKPPKDTTPSDYDYVISYAEQDAIFAKARREYKQQYGIDPCQQSASEQTTVQQAQQSFSTDPLPALNRVGISSGVLPKPRPLGGDDPHPIGRIFILKVFIDCDDYNKPDNPAELVKQTRTAYQRFFYVRDPFQITFILFFSVHFYYDYWSSHGSQMNAESLLDDLYTQCRKYQKMDYELIFGWVGHASDLNGICYQHDFYGLGVENRDGGILYNLIGKDVIVQHELTHMISYIGDDPTPDTYTGWHRDGFNTCLMNYYYACTGTHTWCKWCRADVLKHL